MKLLLPWVSRRERSTVAGASLGLGLLLQSHDGGGRFLSEATAAFPRSNIAHVAEQAGDSIGNYKLLEQIGEGGFGLVYVDYQTQRRLPKDSFDWYRQVIASRGSNLFGKTALPPTQVTDTPPPT